MAIAWNIFEEKTRNEAFQNRLKRTSWHRDIDSWDYALICANCPTIVKIKVKVSGWVGIYFDIPPKTDKNDDKKKRVEERAKHIEEYQNLLTQNGWLKNEDVEDNDDVEDVWEKDGKSLEKRGKITFVLASTIGNTNSPQCQYDACIYLADLLEELYGKRDNHKDHTKSIVAKNKTFKASKKASPVSSANNVDSIDPRTFGVVDESQFRGFPVSKNLKVINEIGEYEIAYIAAKEKRYYLYMEEARPVLDSTLPKDRRIKLKQLVSWPMRALKKSPEDVFQWNEPLEEAKAKNPKASGFYTPRIDANSGFTDGSGIKNPVLHPQFVFLGENWSETGNAGNLQAKWSNGYCEQANVVCDSVLSGAYFTDFIKCFVQTNFQNKNDVIKQLDTYNGNGFSATWFDIYLNIFENELELLNERFKLDGFPKYIIIWGCGLYDILNTLCKKHKKKTISKYFEEKGHTVLVFGVHYSNGGNGHTFLDDQDYDDKELRSRRRIYSISDEYDRSDMKNDRNEKDERRYEFALLEDENGELHLYNGYKKE